MTLLCTDTEASFFQLLLCIHSEGSVVCKMTLNFAAAPLSKSDELLTDLQEKVSSGKVGALSVDSAHILNLEPEVGKIVNQSW